MGSTFSNNITTVDIVSVHAIYTSFLAGQDMTYKSGTYYTWVPNLEWLAAYSTWITDLICFICDKWLLQEDKKHLGRQRQGPFFNLSSQLKKKKISKP